MGMTCTNFGASGGCHDAIDRHILFTQRPNGPKQLRKLASVTAALPLAPHFTARKRFAGALNRPNRLGHAIAILLVDLISVRSAVEPLRVGFGCHSIELLSGPDAITVATKPPGSDFAYFHDCKLSLTYSLCRPTPLSFASRTLQSSDSLRL